MIEWQVKPFSDLTVEQLYDLLKARSDVFVVEQTCIYSDMDDIDKEPETFHVIGYDAPNAHEGSDKREAQGQKLVGTCRILAPGQVYPGQAAIGRVLITEPFRHQGLATSLMKCAIAHCRAAWPNSEIKISAQQHLENFYQALGFKTISDMYLEDDIPHIAMLLSV
jgi:ElaA protein